MGCRERYGGDTIRVKPGRYIENVVIDKPLQLIATDRLNTIVDGGGRGDVFAVSAANTTVANFTMTRAGDGSGVGIYAAATFCNVSFNIISNTHEGIYLSEASDFNRIQYNVLQSNHYGIYLWGSDENDITLNTVRNSSEIGIYVTYYSRLNKIYHNNFLNNSKHASITSQSEVNQWDLWIPERARFEGNYWSNHPCPNPDEVCDNPYIIDPNNQDNAPLCHPKRMPFDFTPPEIVSVECIPTRPHPFEPYPISFGNFTSRETEPILIKANVTDTSEIATASGIERVFFAYRVNQGTWWNAEMNKSASGTYEITIPGQPAKSISIDKTFRQ